MKELLAASAALLFSFTSAHAGYRLALQWHHSVISERQEAKSACLSELNRLEEYKIAITHYDSSTRESHCFVFKGHLLGRESQVISFDGIDWGTEFWLLDRGPECADGALQVPDRDTWWRLPATDYGHHLRTGSAGVGYELVLALSTPDTYRSAKVMVRGQRLWNRDCLVS